MPPNWAWLKDAHYRGKHVIDGTTFDMWHHHFANVELEVAVSQHDASRPEYFYRRAPEEHRMYHFLSFHTFRPNASWFEVPVACKNATMDLTPVDGDDKLVAGTVAAIAAEEIVGEQGFDAASMIVAAMGRAGVSTPSSLWGLQAGGEACLGGPAVGDVFFQGLPAVSAAIYLGNNKFAECAASMGAPCAIVAQRDFTGGCRRYR